MRKIYAVALALTGAMFIGNVSSAQTTSTLIDTKPRYIMPPKTYLNLSWVDQTSTSSEIFGEIIGQDELKSDLGAAFTMGRTFYLHKKPIADMINIGLDWTYIDLQGVSYKANRLIPDPDTGETEINFLQAEYGMHIGPSVTVRPLSADRRLAAKVYFRYAPAASAFADTELSEYTFGFANLCVAGVAVSYSVITLGVENRFGSIKYNDVSKVVTVENQDEVSDMNGKMDLTAMRFYLGFRF